jgi:hypothetical protein
MADCNNPQTPNYNKLSPIAPNPNCGGAGSGVNIILPPSGGSGGGKDAEVLGGVDIAVDDISDTNTDRFVVNLDTYTNVAVSLGIDTPASLPVLKGTTITEVDVSWNYNSESDPLIITQLLTNTFNGTDPVLTAGERSANYTGVTIALVDKTVTIQGGDGRTSDSDVKSITFGNLLAIGVTTPSLAFQDPLQAQGVFDALADQRLGTTQQNASFNAFGTASPPEYMVIAYPKHYGNSIFTKGTFAGGYIRMIRTLRSGIPTWVTSLDIAEVEIDVDIDNGNGFTEPYWFYQSEFAARTGDEPTIITKA